jgi:hypothetical protein
MRKILILLIIPIILYLLFSFVPYKFNPAEWTEELRSFFVWVLCTLEIFIFLGIHIYEL